MASVFSLRNDLRSVVLGGFQRLRDIEIIREVSDFVLLEARMVVAASLDETFDDEWAPSPEEIEAARNAINASWSEDERERRWRHEQTSTRLKRYVADFHYLKEVDGERVSLAAARNKAYRERNRERLRELAEAKRRDPAYVEKKRAASRRYVERHQFLIKEKYDERRDEMNADQRRRTNANRALVNTREVGYRNANREEINARRRELHAQRKRAAVAAC